MKQFAPGASALLALAIALSACSGFSTGTGMPQSEQLPPVGQGTPMPQADKNGLPQPPLPSGSPGAAGTLSYPIADAQKGFACPPTQDGYTCTLSFNLPPPTPAPSASPKSKTSPSPTPSPTATPSATPSPGASGTPLASASPSPTPKAASITLDAQAVPKDAPKMVHQPKNALDTIALMSVKLTTSADFTLDGWARAQFTLPKTQVDGRGFALQIFQVVKPKHGAPDYKPVASFNKSVLADTALTFSFKAPKMTIGKGSTYLLVLYGDDKSTASAAPSGAPSAAASTEPSEEPSSLPSVEPSPFKSPF